jgi:hypothetical protein
LPPDGALCIAVAAVLRTLATGAEAGWREHPLPSPPEDDVIMRPALTFSLWVARIAERRKPRAIVAVCLAALLTGAPASARDATLLDLQPLIGRVIVIETADRPQVVARLISVADSAIVASVAGIETTFGERDVRSVTADQDSLWTGLLIGTGVGTAAAVLGAQGVSCSDCPGTVAAGAVLSLAAFTALGGFIGKHHHRRVTVYRRP